MATYVLVHGSAVGGWYWKRVVPLLRSVGHEVYTPTLTGLGERAHLRSSEIGLETHIQDIVGVIEYENLTNVILGGHSQNTFVALGVADRLVERIAHLIYFDGPVPANGSTILESGPEEWRAWILGQVAETERGKAFILPDVRNFGWIDEADADWFNSKVTPDPFKRWNESLILHNEAALAKIPRTYINAIGDAPGGEAPPEWAKGMNFRDLHASHLAMISAPQALANLLLEAAQ